MNYPPTAESLQQILEKLRAPDGCPWDREQTAESLKHYLVEECAELLDAIDEGDPQHICEELGDVQMNLIFQAVVAAEQHQFTYRDVMAAIIAKMLRRHPHVFGAVKVNSADDVAEIWAKVKAQEKGGAADRRPVSVMDDIPRQLSALITAEKLQKKAAKCGFDWSDTAGIVDKLDEELAELKEAIRSGDEAHIDEELGALMFVAVNLARFRRRNAEDIMRQANAKFKRRFQFIEAKLQERQLAFDQVSIDQMECWWQEAKKQD